MKKAELIDAFRESTGLTRAQAGEYLDRLGDIMAAELLGDGEVSLPGIGKLVVVPTAARAGHNPKTGATIQIPAGKKVALRVSSTLKDALK